VARHSKGFAAMILRVAVLPLAAAVVLLSAPAFATPSEKVEPHTAAAVQAAGEAWAAAEVNGDKTYLEWLLLPGYRAVNYAGKSKDKAAIVAHAIADPARKAEIAKWKAEHPQKPVVQIFGDTAVLMWMADAPGGRIHSCDIFAYRDGHWRAAYSQDTKVDG